MLIVKPSAQLESITPDAIYLIERAGRTCYQSSWKIEEPKSGSGRDHWGNREIATKGSAPAFIKMVMRRGHFSVLEHAHATFRFICDRGVTHEMVRHRIAAYSQESTRFCNYGKKRFGGEIKVVEPDWESVLGEKYWQDAEEVESAWKDAVAAAERAYLHLLDVGVSAQFARSVLPTGLKTEIVATCNFREWLHIFSLRTEANPHAHPQIQEVMDEARSILIAQCPEVFGFDVEAHTLVGEVERAAERAAALLKILDGQQIDRRDYDMLSALAQIGESR